MRIEIKSIDPAAIRYPTCGDWIWLPDGSLQIFVPDYANENRINVFIHNMACSGINLIQALLEEIEKEQEISEGKERYYWGDDPDTKVKIYTNVDCVELYAEKIDLVEYQKRQPKRPLSTRVSSGVGFFMPTSEMIEKRRIEVLEIPEDILSAAFGSPSVKNHKNKYPIINDWASNQEAVKAHYERYQEVVSDKSNFFIRPVSANYTNNIAKSLLNKSSHCILAPILFDSPNPCWVSDYHDILKKHPDLEYPKPKPYIVHNKSVLTKEEGYIKISKILEDIEKDDVIDISIKEYLKLDNETKHHLKGFKLNNYIKL